MENNDKLLLRLYKLLWEEIKNDKIVWLFVATSRMCLRDIITQEEAQTLELSIIVNRGKDESKDFFVQRMIKELENDK